ncbi:MAG: type III pantothenate kinase [Verrucomicrobiota bacterium]
MATADFLLINNNNTRTKFALANRLSLLKHESLVTADLSEDSLRELLDSWEFKSVVLASVVPASVPMLLEACGKAPVIKVSYTTKIGIEIDFPAPETVGADRLANAAAMVSELSGTGAVVVDFGTAVTFDIIDARPAYIGGVIAPGLDAMRHYLHQKTALLPEIELEKPEEAIGKSTVHAMQSGAYHGYRGLTREILNQVIEELDCPAKVIATGGYASLIASGLPEIDLVDPQLTMKGLLRVANLNFTDE